MAIDLVKKLEEIKLESDLIGINAFSEIKAIGAGENSEYEKLRSQLGLKRKEDKYSEQKESFLDRQSLEKINNGAVYTFKELKELGTSLDLSMYHVNSYLNSKNLDNIVKEIYKFTKGSQSVIYSASEFLVLAPSEDFDRDTNRKSPYMILYKTIKKQSSMDMFQLVYKSDENVSDLRYIKGHIYSSVSMFSFFLSISFLCVSSVIFTLFGSHVVASIAIASVFSIIGFFVSLGVLIENDIKYLNKIWKK